MEERAEKKALCPLEDVQIINNPTITHMISDIMARGKDNIATIHVTPAGQLIITIPRAIGAALSLGKGVKMAWIIEKNGLLCKRAHLSTIKDKVE